MDPTPLDPKIVRGVLESTPPDLPTVLRLPKEHRRNRTACQCCGTISLGSYRDIVCYECKKMGCTPQVPSARCPQKMGRTSLLLHTQHSQSHPQIPSFAQATGSGTGFERDDDRCSLFDTVLMEHFGWRRDPFSSLLSGRRHPELPDLVAPLDPPVSDGLPPMQGRTGHYLVHQVLTRSGWYYERVEAQPPLIVLLSRDEGVNAYWRASAGLPDGANICFGPYGEDRYGILRPMRDVLEATGELIGLEALAVQALPAAFLTPIDLVTEAEIVRRVLLVDLYIRLAGISPDGSGASSVPSWQMKTAVNLFVRCKQDVQQYEDGLTQKKSIPRKEATAMLLARQHLAIAGQALQELLNRDL